MQMGTTAPTGSLRRLRQDSGIAAQEMADLWVETYGEPMSQTTLTTIELSDLGEKHRYIHAEERRKFLALVRAAKKLRSARKASERGARRAGVGNAAAAS